MRQVAFYYIPPHRLPVPAIRFVPEDVVMSNISAAPVVLVAGECVLEVEEYIKIIAATRRVAVSTRAVIHEMERVASFADVVIAFPPTLHEINAAVGWLCAGGAPLRELVNGGWSEDFIYNICAAPPELVRAMRKGRPK